MPLTASFGRLLRQHLTSKLQTTVTTYGRATADRSQVPNVHKAT